MYPAALTAFGIIGNVYILGGQIKGLKSGLGTQIDELKGNLGNISEDLKEMRDDIRGLLHRQTEFKKHMTRVEKLAMDCCKNR